MAYYSGDKIRATKADYMIIYGERSNGKTYDTLRHAIDRFAKTGYEQFVYMRRNEDEVTAKHAKQFVANHSEFVKEKFGDTATIEYYAGSYYIYPDHENTREKWLIGHVMSVSGWLKYKSNAYPDVTTIILDEFLSTRRYFYENVDTPLQEFNDFLNNVSTIVRDRNDVKVYLLGNTVSRYSAYFDGFGIDPFKIKQGTIVSFKTKAGAIVAVEHCKGSTGGKKSDKYFDFTTSTSNMIVSGGWEVNSYPDEFNGVNATKLALTSCYRNGTRIKIVQGYHHIFCIVPVKTNLPLLLIKANYKNYAVSVESFNELTYYPKLRTTMNYKLAKGLVVSDSDEATEIFRKKLSRK